MLKKIMLVVALALPMFAAAQTVKIGLVDSQSIVLALPETEGIQKQLQETSQKYENEYRALNEEMQRKYEEYSQMSENEPQAIRDRKTREIQEYANKIQSFEQNASQDLQRLQQELMAPVITKVKNAIDSTAKEGGFTIVSEVSTVLYFAEPAVDITAEVRKKLGL